MNLLGLMKYCAGVTWVVLAASLAAGNAGAQTWEFTSCSATGAEGPLQTECDTAYAGTLLEGEVSVSGGIQSWTVPANGTYRITAVGAQGTSGDAGFVGGSGASLQADFSLDTGTVLQVAVGQVGLENGCNGGGGGGSFVVGPTEEPLLVAGGGGGTRAVVGQNGCDASLTTFGIIGSGGDTTSACTVKNVDEGLGGTVSASSWGSAGAGFFGNGAVDGFATAALSWANGVLGGGVGGSAEGGFGGGGSGTGSCGGGGGGGYSGGDGGRVAGGGGSFAAASAENLLTALAGSGVGSVTIEALEIIPPEPEPSPLPVPAVPLFGIALLAALILLVGLMRRRRLQA
ncbi:hypothetical protein [Kineobactrum salinum]|uniref:IPTL-CTERM sorting domain-containing protein n=1 Tax=Kineobactrum salinum TaxID=2708301 RepID=A0A6C0TZ68_9GAMM|nr:hypothetical protein [Kineobactrum salinum]QIB64948.1 hypothetical protein G3T16_05615 [Kineobactrum salinum]